MLEGISDPAQRWELIRKQAKDYRDYVIYRNINRPRSTRQEDIANFEKKKEELRLKLLEQDEVFLFPKCSISTLPVVLLYVHHSLLIFVLVFSHFNVLDA